ncbi:MAG: hypothetical protein COV10_00280 [Candidatus Vogelbacteria bacterium CG10_big_fil_rev_8_21_14_0_10_51_16]|uniref:GIY-YIG domain-containing protein n=1 Tax=Candidatus Vogelbacteria bacterium CG10_big_fil_rev_8_21_14_0_10_51_16 TaxID=1975045 RepID=A0A2H0RFV7_9BACT|nr:MAG: hypothetical protein COV10_00280 [Candidatus Vogelbacteria bacterium CG10_big_fil_rev_8_21_14_0_10_51_16]
MYILASKRNGTLYIGVTNDLARRVQEHKQGIIEGFTKKYHVHMLVWYEEVGEITSAIAREKQMKEWQRAWKIRLIDCELRNSDLFPPLARGGLGWGSG